MKNVVLTTLSAGCFALSSAVAQDNCKNCGFKFTAKASAGVAFAGKVKAKDIYHDTDTVTGVTYGTSGKYDSLTKEAVSNKSADKNTKKKSSAFIGVNLGTKYYFNDLISLGGEVFYDAMNVKFQLKDKVEGLDNTAKIRGRYGMMVVLGWNPMEKMSVDFGIGIAKTTKIKDLHVKCVYKTDKENDIRLINNIKFKNSFGLALKLGSSYAFNDNLSLGLDLTMQKVKAKNKKARIDNGFLSVGKLAKFKCSLYTIGATLTYTF